MIGRTNANSNLIQHIPRFSSTSNVANNNVYNYITLDTKNKSTLEIGELVTGTNATLNYCNIKNGDDGGTVIASYTSTFTDKKTIDISNYDLVTIVIYGSAKAAYQTINVNDIYLY